MRRWTWSPARLHADGIAVNSVAPVAAVLALATSDARSCTGRILYSGPFLDEIGRKPKRAGVR